MSCFIASAESGLYEELRASSSVFESKSGIGSLGESSITWKARRKLISDFAPASMILWAT